MFLAHFSNPVTSIIAPELPNTAQQVAMSGTTGLSSRVMGLKFMQRAQEKQQLASAEASAAERDAEAHWVVEGARSRCVVLAEGDPPPEASTSGAVGRMSFGGFSKATEALHREQADKAAAAAAAAEAANPEGKAVSDEAMAASLQQQRQRGGGGKGKQRQQEREQQHGGGGKHGGKHGGGKKRGRDEEQFGSGKRKQGGKKMQRYF